MKWGEDNHVKFNIMQDETISFTSKRKLELKRKIVEARFTVQDHTMVFKT